MRKISIFIIVLLVIVVGVWYFSKSPKKESSEMQQQPLTVSKHTSAFINSVDSAMESYYVVADAFVKWDSITLNTKVAALQEKLKAVQVSELKKDTGGIYETAQSFLDNANNDVQSIQQENNLESKKRSLNSLSENIFNFLRVVRYDKSKLYLQECPMAFNDTESGLWLSKTPEIRNPYLGMHHPRYKSGMLKCGETKETLNYTGTE